MAKAILLGLVIGLAAFVMKDKQMDKQIEDTDKLSKNIIGEITKLAEDKDQVYEAAMKASEIAEIIDEYAEKLSSNKNYAKTIAQMSVKRCKKRTNLRLIKNIV